MDVNSEVNPNPRAIKCGLELILAYVNVMFFYYVTCI